LNWIILLYFPLACLAMGFAGRWALRNTPDLRSYLLGGCRWLLLLFPFVLLFAMTYKPIGPGFWMYGVAPLPWRWFVLALLAIIICSRWVIELITIQAFNCRVHSPELERPAPAGLIVDMGFEGVLDRISRLGRLGLMPRPGLFLSKVTTAGHLTSGLFPRLCLDASLVPERYRDHDIWWESVMPAPPMVEKSLEPLKAVLIHELAHFGHGDHLRTFVAILSGALLPWEWLFEEVPGAATGVTGNWLFRQWSRLMKAIGGPVRGWLKEERRIREALADEEAGEAVRNAADHLRAVRELYPAGNPENAPDTRTFIPPACRRLALWALAVAILWAAPGRQSFLAAFGKELRTTQLPSGWWLTMEGGSRASAVFIPGEKGGRVRIDCERIDPGHPLQFRAIGRQKTGQVPSPCVIEMEWDLHYSGRKPLSGKEVAMSLTQSAQTVRNNNDLFAAYAIPSMPGHGTKPGWTRYAMEAHVQESAQMDLLYICYTFSSPGSYIFKPPHMTIVLPSGERMPYPIVQGQ